jgi:MYXO-CTERM domain-containing protein
MRKTTTAALGVAAALSLTPVVATPAEAHGAPAHQTVIAETPAPTPNNNDGNGNKGLNGLWGLLGLAGLLGLIPRRRKPEQPAQRPQAQMPQAQRPQAMDTTGAMSGSHEYQANATRNRG